MKKCKSRPKLTGNAHWLLRCTMTLIRGARGLCPCPRCLVPIGQLYDLSKVDTLRTTHHTMALHKQANTLRAAKDKDAVYKPFGLRPIEVTFVNNFTIYFILLQNSFMRIANSCPYEAASSDDLHMDESGLGGAHLLPQLKAHITAQGRAAEVTLDSRYVHQGFLTSSDGLRFKATPRWRNLNHFDSVMTLSFNDGSKHRDIAKVRVRFHSRFCWWVL